MDSKLYRPPVGRLVQPPWLTTRTPRIKPSSSCLCGDQSLLHGVTKPLVSHFRFLFLNSTDPKYLVTCQDMGILLSCYFQLSVEYSG